MAEYNFSEIEKKWQNIWAQKQYGKSEDFSDKPKHYHLLEFPYPSGAGLHVGHCMSYGASDAYCRMKRMQGFNVMFPMGWDAFGLPTENYAIKNKIKPAVATEKNVATFKEQMNSLGYSFDWSREINTTDPAYYKWTQWIFLQFFKHAVVDGKLVKVDDNDTITPRLAFQAEMPVNWCPSCKIILANEEVIGGNCERCGTQTEKRKQKQWMLRITDYADRLIEDLKTVDYLEQIKQQQINWIGKSEGSLIKFEIRNSKFEIETKSESEKYIEVFTTRADTLFGCTYIVLAPESPLVEKLKSYTSNLSEIEKYISDSSKKSDLERTELVKDKTGVELKGIKAINPINNEKVSVWIADYVLASYGTGAVMAVPAHDERDFEFAKKYGIDIKQVIIPVVIDKHDPPKEGAETIFRDAIQGIVIDPKTNKVLTLRWKKFPWTTFVTGGIEQNEDKIQAAKREIEEETGYKNLKFVRPLGGPVESHFFASHKNVNRKAHFNAFVFELEDETQIETSQDEKDIHEIVWQTWDEIKNDKNIKCAEYEIWLDRFFNKEHAFTDYGVLINSGEFSGMTSEEAKKAITEKLKEDGSGNFVTNFKLRDWIFSRQHYWGEPIPIIHCEKCGLVPVPEDQLPVTLPEVENYEPTDTGESPLASISEWVNVKCPSCGGAARRETDTMPNWAGSSWYFLRYCDPKSDKRIAEDGKLNYWMPVDLYNGGAEHITLHLLYSRFWHKFLFDLGVVPGPEPYAKRIIHGIILGPDGQKMSKSKGNVINPDDIVKEFGADTLRAYIMFIGPYDQESAWNMAGVSGVFRFLKRVWKNIELAKGDDSEELLVKLNQTIVGLTDDLENFHMNTAVAKMMELNNTIEECGNISKESYQIFLKLLFPIAPHIAEEIWQKAGFEKNIEDYEWPKANQKYLVAKTVVIAIQINGKLRDTIEVAAGIAEKEIVEKAKKQPKINKLIEGKKIIKTIYVPAKILNIVIAP